MPLNFRPQSRTQSSKYATALQTTEQTQSSKYATALQTTEQIQSSKYAFVTQESRSEGRHLTEVGCKKVDLKVAIPLKWDARKSI
jgi:hypothetical protein